MFFKRRVDGGKYLQTWDPSIPSTTSSCSMLINWFTSWACYRMVLKQHLIFSIALCFPCSTRSCNTKLIQTVPHNMQRSFKNIHTIYTSKMWSKWLFHASRGWKYSATRQAVIQTRLWHPSTWKINTLTTLLQTFKLRLFWLVQSQIKWEHSGTAAHSLFVLQADLIFNFGEPLICICHWQRCNTYNYHYQGTWRLKHVIRHRVFLHPNFAEDAVFWQQNTLPEQVLRNVTRRRVE